MTLSVETEKKLIEIVREAAREEIMPRFRHLKSADVKTKSAPDDLVTEADIRAEAHISQAVANVLPDATIIGEEAVEADATLLDQVETAEMSVIIDPVDGTWNFAKGLATFGVILAIAERGDTIFGLLYDPVVDDWVITRKGGGTWFETAGGLSERMTIDASEPDEATGGVPLFQFPVESRTALAAEVPGFRRIWSVRCSCHEYRMMAMGGADYLLSHALKPWDHAAGALAVVEAGGAIGLLDGRAYRASITSGGYLVAARSDNMLSRVRKSFGTILPPAD